METRVKYDIPTYKQDIEQSTKIGAWHLNPIMYDLCNNKCRVPTPGIISKVGVSVDYSKSLVDVESDLKNITRQYSKDPSKKYKPECPDMNKSFEGYPCGGGVTDTGNNNLQQKLHHYPECNTFGPLYTRMYSNKDLRSIGINRFHYLPHDPQDPSRWYSQAPSGTSSRLLMKDNHVPCIPTLIDQSVFQPNNPTPPRCTYSKHC
jgi:hypothetical protein